MERITLLSLTCQMLDLETEKKAYNKEINDRIKEIKESIKANVKDSNQEKLGI
jgi:hypothetical protein